MNLKLPNFLKVYFYVFLLITFSLFISKGGLIRIFSYLSTLMLIYFFIEKYLKSGIQYQLGKVLLIPITYIVLNMIATKEIAFNNEYTKLVLATSFGIGLFVLSKYHKIEQKCLLNTIVILIIAFIAFQLISIFLLGKLNGTTKNPHYLALYSAYALEITLFYFFTESRVFKHITYLLVPILLGLILSTSSRPTWIALFIAALLMVFFLKDNIKNITLILVLLIPTILFITNVWNFGGRLEELFFNISTEERVVIWSDTWTMQKSSTVLEWIFGHGLNSFEENFKLFSHYHLLGNDFTMPHNSVLEVLYATGIIGILLFCLIYFFTTFHLIKIIKKDNQFKKLALLLFSMIIVNLFMGLITIKWFTHLNSYILVAIVGLTIFINQSDLQEK